MGYTPIVMWWDGGEDISESEIDKRLSDLNRLDIDNSYSLHKNYGYYSGIDVVGLLWTKYCILDCCCFCKDEFLQLQKRLIDQDLKVYGDDVKYIHLMLHD